MRRDKSRSLLESAAAPALLLLLFPQSPAVVEGSEAERELWCLTVRAAAAERMPAADRTAVVLLLQMAQQHPQIRSRQLRQQQVVPGEA